MKKKTYDFFIEHYEKNKIPSVFTKIFYTQEKKTITNVNYQEIENLIKINSVIFIPDYINTNVNTNVFNVKRISHFFKGYAIFLDDFSSVNDYLKYRFKKNSKSILKRLRRLESCFSIKYTFYYGEISMETYNSYMELLKKMIIRRFQERGNVSQTLRNWEHYQKIYFKLINQKKATLFIIENNLEPICISLNNHFNGKLFSSVSSYDINYSKFSLGSIEIYKKLEWCINNNHNTYEFGMGDLTYKREWSNHIYNFEQQIIYKKKSLKTYIFAHIEFFKANFKESIYKLTYVRYKKWKQGLKKQPKKKLTYNTFNIENSTDIESLPKVNFNENEYLFLKKPIFNFLYSNIENISNITVREESKTKKSYLIIGKDKKQRIVFT